MTGAEMIIHALKKEGVRALFGYPGGAVIDIFDALYNSDIPFYLTRHEQAAVHAADGFSRASGEVGVCLATSGPGATNGSRIILSPIFGVKCGPGISVQL